MELDEFEAQYKQAIEENLNQLQTAILLLAQLEARITNVGQNLQNLSQAVEEYLTQQRTE
jgi:prefoldin subunit 5